MIKLKFLSVNVMSCMFHIVIMPLSAFGWTNAVVTFCQSFYNISETFCIGQITELSVRENGNIMLVFL